MFPSPWLRTCCKSCQSLPSCDSWISKLIINELKKGRREATGFPKLPQLIEMGFGGPPQPRQMRTPLGWWHCASTGWLSLPALCKPYFNPEWDVWALAADIYQLATAEPVILPKSP